MYNKTITLQNGVPVPMLALGTWFIDNRDAAGAVSKAVEIGYRHFDTAQAYGNEEGVGEGIRNCGIHRKDLFVTSKVAAEHKTYQSAAASIDETLQKMKLDYLDMMIIHSPQPWVEVNQSDNRYVEGNREAWRALEDALKVGKLRGNPEHMRCNASLDFTISDADMETLKHIERIKGYGEYSRFPVFGGKYKI